MSIDVNYFSFSPSRADKKWPNFSQDIASLRAKYQKWAVDGENDYQKLTSQLTKGEKLLFEYGADYLFVDNDYNQEVLFQTMKNLDLQFGSVKDNGFESGNIESYLLDSLVKASGAATENGLPTKEAWINIFSTIDDSLVDRFVADIRQKMDWEEGESRVGVLDYLRVIRPVVKDLKQTSDSIFVSYCPAGSEYEPESSEKFLAERARTHIEKYRGLLPPVL